MFPSPKKVNHWQRKGKSLEWRSLQGLVAQAVSFSRTVSKGLIREQLPREVKPSPGTQEAPKPPPQAGPMPRASCSRLLSQGRSHQTLTLSQTPRPAPLPARAADVGKGWQLLSVPTPCSKGISVPGQGWAPGPGHGGSIRALLPVPRAARGAGAWEA